MKSASQDTETTDDKNVRLQKITYPNGREVYYNYLNDRDDTAEIKYYGRLNRVHTIASDPPVDNDPLGDDKKFVQYEYLGAATVVVAEYPDVTNDPKLTRVATGDNPYDETLDPFGRVIDHRWKGSSYLDRYTYGYDRNSNRLYRKNELSATHSELYHANGADLNDAYDQLDRLKDFRRGTLSEDSRPNDTISSNITRVQQFTLDQVGNWDGFKEDADGTNWDLEQSRSHNKVNEIDTNNDHSDAPGESISASPGTDWTDPAYDAVGNMTLAPRPGDEGSDDNALVCVYDAWNRLREVYADEDEDRVGDAGELIATYSYDGLNRRIRKDIDGGSTYDYYYNVAWQMLEVRKDATPEDDNVHKQYVWDIRYIDAPVLRDENKDLNEDNDCTEAHDERLYYCNDANFNVTALLNTDGTVAERYEYDPYGKVTFMEGDWDKTQIGQETPGTLSAYDNQILYCGYRYDPETGLYCVRHRYHHPPLGRWMQRDPIGYPDGMNLYEYAHSAPMSVLDPSGLWGVDIHKSLTFRLAAFVANLNCPLEIANGANRPDEDYRRPGGKGASDAIIQVIVPLIGPAIAELKLNIMAEWHFPADPGGEVRAGSDAAKRIALAGIAECDLTKFSEGLHTLQDSWSHQGRPPIEGVGHRRGIKWVDAHWGWTDMVHERVQVGDQYYYQASMVKAQRVRIPGQYKDISETPGAFFSTSTDQAKLWPKDIRELGIETYEMMIEFRKQCPCACPDNAPTAMTLNGRTLPAKDRAYAIGWLLRNFPGDNVRAGERVKR